MIHSKSGRASSGPSQFAAISLARKFSARSRPIQFDSREPSCGCGNIELIGYHESRGPGGDGEDKGEDEEKLDHGRASAVAIGNGG
jgi:hypothetical protein